VITFFTTGKAFLGHNGIIQRNALQSWKFLHPDVEVILFGDDAGAAQVCAELDLLHEPKVEFHESGTKYLNYMFERAQEIARHNYLCFSNCDIVLFKDFIQAFEIARGWRESFLAVGRRWDTDVTEAIDFKGGSWDQGLRSLALSHGIQQDKFWIDYFLFRRGLYKAMPPLIVGHCYWDNWMVWKALSATVPVIDFSAFVMAVHQNHGYNPKFGRAKGIATDELSLENLRIIGGTKHARTIGAATHRIGEGGKLRQNLRRYLPSITFDIWLPTWHFFLDRTRSLRSALGLRSNAARWRERK
jgi:hypothetical protein